LYAKIPKRVDYLGALHYFQLFLDKVIRDGANVLMVFDGKPYSMKKYENARRRQNSKNM